MSETEEQTEDRRWRQVVHLFGFVGGERNQVEVSHHQGTVAEVSAAVMAAVRAQGYNPLRVSRTTTLDGWLVAVEYEVPNKPPHEDMPMWHIFRRPAEPWPIEARHPRPAMQEPTPEEAL